MLSFIAFSIAFSVSMSFNLVCLLQYLDIFSSKENGFLVENEKHISVSDQVIVSFLLQTTYF